MHESARGKDGSQEGQLGEKKQLEAGRRKAQAVPCQGHRRLLTAIKIPWQMQTMQIRMTWDTACTFYLR